jgi:hypothetical protein
MHGIAEPDGQDGRKGAEVAAPEITPQQLNEAVEIGQLLTKLQQTRQIMTPVVELLRALDKDKVQERSGPEVRRAYYTLHDAIMKAAEGDAAGERLRSSEDVPGV